VECLILGFAGIAVALQALTFRMLAEHRRRHWRQTVGTVTKAYYVAMDENVFAVADVSYAVGNKPFEARGLLIGRIDLKGVSTGSLLALVVHPSRLSRCVVDRRSRNSSSDEAHCIVAA